jgi:DNA-directed RNA polymerase specialized sigma24 family protein
MVNTKKSQVFLKKTDTGQIAPHDDAYTVRDSHFVGHDGFIVPNNFSEFYQRFPAFVADWVRRRVRDCVSATEADDWTQELLLHLAVLPTCSKHRRDGKEDVIQTFSPDRMHGANEARFRSFINRCLSNKFNTLYRRWRKRPLSNPGNLSFEADAAHGAQGAHGASDEFCHSHSEYLRQAGCRSREREEQRFRLDEFARFGEASIPGLQVVLEAFHRTGNWKETAMTICQPRCDAIQRRARKQGRELATEVRLL